MMRVDAMDPDGTSDKYLLADMAHDIKVLKDRQQDSMLELASKKAIILKQAPLKLSFRLTLLRNKLKKLPSSEQKQNS